MARVARIITALVAVSLSLTLGVAAPAQAGSAAGLAANAWLVGDLAAQGYGAIQQSPEVTAWEAQQVASATTGTKAASGTTVKPKAGGKLGMILNTVGVLGGLAVLWPGNDAPDTPDIPLPPAPPPSTVWIGSPQAGWTTAPGATMTYSVYQGRGSTAIGLPRTLVGSGNDSFCATSNLNDPNPYAGFGGTYSKVTDPMMVTSQHPLSPAKWMHYKFGMFHPGNFVSTCNSATVNNLPYQTMIPQNGTTIPNPNQPSAQPDPKVVPRYIDSTITCKNGQGASQVIESRVGPFTFDPSGPATLPEVPDLACPAGTWLSSGKRELATEGSTSKVPLVEPYNAPDWVQQQATDFPECMPVGSTACQLEVFKVRTSSPDDDLSCNSVPASASHPCLQWASDPDRNTRYDCRFGPYPAPMKNCLAYADTFAGAGVKTSPDTETPPDEVIPTPFVDPSPELTPDDSECIPSSAVGLLNPVWVYKAAKCALVWAFVPEPGYLDSKVAGLQTAFGDTLPGAYVTAVTGQTWDLDTAGCGGIPVAWTISGQHFAFDLLAACSGFMATTATVVKLAATVGVVIFGSLACLRALGAGLGWNPGIGKGGPA